MFRNDLRFAAISIACLLVSLRPTISAEMAQKKDYSDRVWTLTGSIVLGDEEKLQRIVNSRKPDITPVLWTFSDGGDVETAMKMGRILRNAEIPVTVVSSGYCRSACVFLLIGSVMRAPIGDVTIHRPYFVSLDLHLSAAEVDARYKRLKREVYEYMAEMNVPAALADAMFAIPPEKGHRLTGDELDRYMMHGPDPAYDERITARNAAKLGISMQEYRRREAAFSAIWPPPAMDTYLSCLHAVIDEGKNPAAENSCRPDIN